MQVDLRDVSSIPGSGRSPVGSHGSPLQYSLPGESHGQRSLVGYSPRGSKELDTTEQLHFHFLSFLGDLQGIFPLKINKLSAAILVEETQQYHNEPK